MAGSTYIDAWEPSTGPGDTSAISGQALYKFGLRDKRQLALKQDIDQDIQSINKLGQWHQDLAVGNNPAETVIAHFIPVNGIPFYHMFGKVANTITDQKQTITPIGLTEGRKPRYNTVERIDAGIPDVVWANVCHDLSVRYEGGNVVCTQVSRGEQAEPEDVTPEPATYPDAGVVANAHESSPFNVLKHFKWNTSEITTPIMVELRATQTTTPSMGSSGQYENISESHNIGVAFTLLYSGIETALKADLKSKTSRQIDWYMQKGNNGNHYFEVTTATAYCKAITTQKLSGDKIFNTASFICGAPSIVVQDFIDESVFYA